MLFNSAAFLVFFAVLLLLYAVVRRDGGRRWLLVLASWFFYGHWDARYVVLLLVSTVVDYVAGGRIADTDDPRARRRWLTLSLVTNLGLLGVFKYGNFLLDTLDPLLSGLGVSVGRLPAAIPVGISFYTFQTLSYTVDVYRGGTKPCRSFRDFALFVSFFPQLVAGPILRAREFFPQIVRLPRLDAERFGSGVQRFALGLFKKAVVADNLSLYVDAVFAAPDGFSSVALWCGAFGFALQVYLDFSGYADMAIGLARIFGVRLPENFDAPYLARSVSDFWRRWHMTMSRWLRDYVYIPLGGSRGGEAGTYRNLFLTMLASGLWHGAAWTFVVWGGFHGVVLALERALGLSRRDDADDGPGLALLRWASTFTLVSAALVMFRSESFASLGVYLQRMFSAPLWLDNGETTGLAWFAVVLSWLLGQFLERRFALRERLWRPLPAPLQGFALAALVLTVAVFWVDEIQFVYFEF